jgi:hypothetical protein
MTQPGATPEHGSIEEQFRRFHAENPHVYRELVRLARQARAAGAERLGMKQLFEVLRWEHQVRTSDWTGFRLNNNYTSYYARQIMDQEPDLRGVFETRQLHAPALPTTLFEVAA